jgi:undecaprenyl-diphosphatase
MSRRSLLLGCLGLLGFLALSIVVAVHPAPLPFDRSVHRLALEHREHLIGFASFVTDLGTLPVVLPLLLLAAIPRAQRHGRWLLVLVAPLLLFAGQLVRFAVMELIHRPRPSPDDWVRIARGWSFPSGHTTTSALGFGLILLLVSAELTSRWARAVAGVVLLGLAALVGISRIVLGVHWPTDALAGWSLALAVTAAAAMILRLVDRPEIPERHPVDAHA